MPADQWNTDGLVVELRDKLALDPPLAAWAAEEGVDQEVVRERLYEGSDTLMADKTAAFGPEMMRQIEKQFLLQTIDGSGAYRHVGTPALGHRLRGYAQRDPLSEYKTEAFALFEACLMGCAST